MERAMREKIEKAAEAEKLRLSKELEEKDKAVRDAALQAEIIKAELEQNERDAAEKERLRVKNAMNDELRREM
jgi:hypothetical protein